MFKHCKEVLPDSFEKLCKVKCAGACGSTFYCCACAQRTINHCAFSSFFNHIKSNVIWKVENLLGKLTFLGILSRSNVKLRSNSYDINNPPLTMTNLYLNWYSYVHARAFWRYLVLDRKLPLNDFWPHSKVQSNALETENNVSHLKSQCNLKETETF